MAYRVHKNYKTVSAEEFNELIDLFKLSNVQYETSGNACYVQLETPGNIYTCSLTGNDDDITNIGSIANNFYKKCNIHDIRGQYGYTESYSVTGKLKVKWDYETACGYQYFDEYYAKKPLKCWSYDINSAFPFAMLNPMPDTTKEPRYNSDIQKGEIGFYKSGGATTKVGTWAEIIFPLIDSPFKKYVYDLYEMKKSATGKERDNYKKQLNYATGLVARRNIFLRNALIYYSNQYIKRYIDDDTVYCNVDCIVSLKPRYDLPIGNNIGQFKQEHDCDDFKYIKSGIYQWGHECHYVGIPTGILNDIEDISNWTKGIKYKFENERVILNNEI